MRKSTLCESDPRSDIRTEIGVLLAELQPVLGCPLDAA
jgi:hypothetical protein